MSSVHPTSSGQQEAQQPGEAMKMTLDKIHEDTVDNATLRSYAINARDYDQNNGEPLKTPAHRRMVSSDGGALEVRKRSLESPNREEAGEKSGDGKKRQVAKSLSFGNCPTPTPVVEGSTPEGRRRVARCLYGSPSVDDKLLENFKKQTLKDVNAFRQRYSIVEKLSSTVRGDGTEVITYKCIQN